MTNKELYNDFFQQVGKTEQEILSIIQAQYDEGNTFMTNKRLELDTNYELYKNTAEKNWDIWDETTYATVNALMARAITEEFRWEFEASNPKDQIVAENLNSVLQQDYDKDDLLAVELYWEFFKDVMWVKIKIDIAWNWKTKTPVFNYVDPRSWIPDPNWDYATWLFAYSWFETMVWEFAIDQEWLDVENLKPFNWWISSSSLQKFRDQQLEWFINIWPWVYNEYYDIYYHYFYVQDKKGKQRKAMAITWNSRTLLLKIQLYEDLSDDIECEFPFSFEYYGFEPNNPLWDNVVNHTAEPQKVKALMRNLRVKKAKAELYPMYFYNDKYLAKKDLAFWFNKFIPVTTKQDWAVDLNAIVTSFKPDSRADNSYIVDTDLDKQVERATSIGSNIQWSTVEWTDKKATELNLIQWNSDINIAYREKISNLWKKQFVKVWFQSYMRNFEEWDKKLILLYDWIWATPVELTKKDFFLASYNKIRIRSRTQIEIQRRKEISALSQLTNLVASLEWIDNFQKILLLRDYAESLGYEKKKILTRLSWWPEEELIKQENEILSNDEFFPIAETDNHLMHIILQKPIQNWNNASKIHWNSHIEARIKTWKPINSSTNWTQQAIQASMASTNAAQVTKEAPTAQITTF